MSTPTHSPPDPTGARGAFVLDVGGRQSGKTWRGLDWVSKDTEHRILVVSNAILREQALIIARAEWPEVRWFRINVLTAGQARAALSDKLLEVDVRLWVDDVDVVLDQLLCGRRRRIAGASVTATLAGELTAEPADEAP